MKIDFAKYSSVRIGGVFEVQLIDESVDFQGFVIGGANNLLISPHPKTLGILDKKFNKNAVDISQDVNFSAEYQKVFINAGKVAESHANMDLVRLINYICKICIQSCTEIFLAQFLNDVR